MAQGAKKFYGGSCPLHPAPIMVIWRGANCI